MATMGSHPSVSMTGIPVYRQCNATSAILRGAVCYSILCSHCLHCSLNVILGFRFVWLLIWGAIATPSPLWSQRILFRRHESSRQYFTFFHIYPGEFTVLIFRLPVLKLWAHSMHQKCLFNYRCSSIRGLIPVVAVSAFRVAKPTLLQHQILFPMQNVTRRMIHDQE